MHARKLIIIWLLLMSSGGLFAQEKKYYDGAIAQAETNLKNGQIERAERTFNAAKTLARQGGFSFAKAEDGLKRVAQAKMTRALGFKDADESLVIVETKIALSVKKRTQPKPRAASPKPPANGADKKVKKDDLESETYVKLKYEEFLTKVKYPFKTNKNISGDLTYNFLDFSYRHGWNRMNHGDYYESKKVFNYVLDNIGKIDTTDAKNLNVLSSVYGGLDKFEIVANKDDKKSYQYAMLSVYYAKKASEQDKTNDQFKVTLANSLRNLTLADTLYFNNQRKELATKEYCALAKETARKMGIASKKAFFLCSFCCIDESNLLIKQKQYTIALNKLDSLAQQITVYQQKFFESSNLTLKKADIYLAMANIAYYNKKDDTLHQTYFNEAFNTFVKFVAACNSEVPSDLTFMKNTADDLIANVDLLQSKDVASQYYERLITVMEPMIQANIDVTELAKMSIMTRVKTAGLQLRKSKPDSTSALKYLGEAIAIFENSNLLNSYDGYSDDIMTYGKMYNDHFLIAVARNNSKSIAHDYSQLSEELVALYEKYPYDFYLKQHLMNASIRYGEILYKQGNYQQAIKPLRYASYEGTKESSDMLVQIYNSAKFKNKLAADTFMIRSQMQSKGIKRFNVPLYNNQQRVDFYVYVFDRAKGHPYKGFSDQAEWVKEARGLEVPGEVIAIGNKLQDFAWNHNISYQDLCVKAYDAEAYKTGDDKKIFKTSSSFLCDHLFSIYRSDTKRLLAGSTGEEILMFYKLYLSENDDLRADTLVHHILKTDTSVLKRFLVSIASYAVKKDTKTEMLFLTDKSQLMRYKNYFRTLGPYLPESDLIKLCYFYNLTAIDSSLYKNKPVKEILTQLAADYNSLAWYSIITKNMNRVEGYLQKSIELDPGSPYPYSNMPHVYVLSGNFEKAKSLYLEYKNKPFNKNYPVYKDAFLSDFKDFEKAGIMNDDIKKIKTLLEQP